MALSVTTEERLASAVAYLREAGHEEEARTVEALLNGRLPRRRVPSSESVEPVPIADAAERLGVSPTSVRRQIELGMLEGAGDASDGYQFVTRASLDYRLETQRMLAIVAEPLPGEPEPEPGETSLLAQMLAHAAELDRTERS